MKRIAKSVLCFVLCVVMAIPFSLLAFAEESAVPTIVIPGLFQSDVRMYDADGNEMTQYKRPFFLDDMKTIVLKAIKKVAAPLLATILFQHDFGGKLAENLADGVGDIVFGKIGSDENGRTLYNIKPVRYDTNVANLSPEDAAFVLNAMPLDGYVNRVGRDNLYFLSYNSFGSVAEIAGDLYNLIQTAKAEHGVDKVNIVPISQGASIANYLLEYYPQVVNDLHKIIYVVPALDGANVLGDLYIYGLNDEKEAIYGYMFGGILKDDVTAAIVNLAIRLLPNKVVNDVLDKLMDGAIEKIKYSTAIWALIPSNYYEQARDKYLSGENDGYIRSLTDEYYAAQTNSRKNILAAKEAGVQVFDVVNYNHALYPIAKTWDEVNADGIIHLDSTSMGAVSAPVDGTLPEGYAQRGNDYGTCSDPSHNHIDPHNMVDASAGLLPDHTFYFYDGDHEKTAQNDVVIKLVERLMWDESFTDVYSYPDEFPQFNNARVSRGLIADSARAKNADKSAMSAEDAAALEKAIAKVDEVIADTAADPEAFAEAKAEFYAVYDRITGEDHSEKEISFFGKVVLWLEKLVNKTTGQKGYSDVLRFWE